jgi:hypothetical protein
MSWKNVGDVELDVFSPLTSLVLGAASAFIVSLFSIPLGKEIGVSEGEVTCVEQCSYLWPMVYLC